MASLLDEILHHRSPLVIGYGGWEGDVIMAALKRRLQQPLPYNLYWFCYQQNEVNLLPDWLKSHQQVYFVVPPLQITSQRSFDELIKGEMRLKEQLEPSPLEETKWLQRKEEGQNTLPATQVMVRLIQSFDLKAPKLTNDPLGFFAEYLDSALLQGYNADGESDIYYIRSTVERVITTRIAGGLISPTRALLLVSLKGLLTILDLYGMLYVALLIIQMTVYYDYYPLHVLP